jgi:calcineurin-like phosphoesterase
MTGPYHSVIGVDKDIVLRRFLTGLGGRMEASKEGAELHGVLIAIDEASGKARTIDRVCLYR